MVSVYMPDERISMFPYTLSSELLSLGAGVDSYALSCGVTLDEQGEVTSFEVCPSKVRVTRRLSYVQLDDLFWRGGGGGGGMGMGRGVNSGGVVGGGITAAVEDSSAPGGGELGELIENNNNNNNNNMANKPVVSSSSSSSSSSSLSLGIDGLMSSDLLSTTSTTSTTTANNNNNNSNMTDTNRRTSAISSGSGSTSTSSGSGTTRSGGGSGFGSGSGVIGIVNDNGYPTHIRSSPPPPRQSFAPSIPVTSADATMKVLTPLDPPLHNSNPDPFLRYIYSVPPLH